MRIDVYDFDGTLFDGESTTGFWRYCLRRRPALLRFLPGQAFAGLMVALRLWDATRGKQAFLRYLRGLDAEAMAQDFWSDPRRLRRLAPWLRRAPGDIPFAIASASPTFLLLPAADRLGADWLVATPVDAAGAGDRRRRSAACASSWATSPCAPCTPTTRAPTRRCWPWPRSATSCATAA